MPDRAAAVFLDRDGTINVRPPQHRYVRSVEDFEWLPGALEGMLVLARAGMPLIVVSNQRGVARGLVSHDVLARVEDIVQAALAQHGHSVLAFRYCTHDVWERCSCRKPQPGLLTAAATEFGLDLSRCWMIGDSEDDVAAGEAAGCRALQVGTVPRPPSRTALSLLDAARIVLSEMRMPI